jgi:hypothetical protein
LWSRAEKKHTILAEPLPYCITAPAQTKLMRLLAAQARMKFGTATCGYGSDKTDAAPCGSGSYKYWLKTSKLGKANLFFSLDKMLFIVI